MLNIYPILLRYMIKDLNNCNSESKLLANSVINDDAENKLVKLIESLFDIKQEGNFPNIMNYIEENNISIVRVHYTYRDLNLPHEYYERMSKLLNDKDAFRREVLLERKEN